MLAALGSAGRSRARHTRRVEAPGAPSPTTPSRSTSPRNACGSISAPSSSAISRTSPDSSISRPRPFRPGTPSCRRRARRTAARRAPRLVDDRGADDLDHVRAPVGRPPRHRRRGGPASPGGCSGAAPPGPPARLGPRQARSPSRPVRPPASGAGRGEPAGMGQPPPPGPGAHGVDVVQRVAPRRPPRAGAPHGRPRVAATSKATVSGASTNVVNRSWNTGPPSQNGRMGPCASPPGWLRRSCGPRARRCRPGGADRRAHRGPLRASRRGSCR